MDFLHGLPVGLSDPLVSCYQIIGKNFIERRWEPAELNGGKFCEIVYTILDGYISGHYNPEPKKPRNMAASCKLLEQTPASVSRIGDHSCRLLIPRLLVPLYDIRNSRGVGHVGGDVNPNFQDASAVLTISSWIMAELIRIFNNVPLAEAEQMVNSLLERKHPLVWELDGIKRVLSSGFTKIDETVALLYTELGWVPDKSLQQWVEYRNLSNFRSKILLPLHRKRLIEYNTTTYMAQITPLGVAHAEGTIFKTH